MITELWSTKQRCPFHFFFTQKTNGMPCAHIHVIRPAVNAAGTSPHSRLTEEVRVNTPGLQEDRDQTAWEPISRTVPVRSSCLGSAPGGVLVAAAIYTVIRNAVETEITALLFNIPSFSPCSGLSCLTARSLPVRLKHEPWCRRTSEGRCALVKETGRHFKPWYLNTHSTARLQTCSYFSSNSERVVKRVERVTQLPELPELPVQHSQTHSYPASVHDLHLLYTLMLQNLNICINVIENYARYLDLTVRNG